jgi:hypothetical protein
MKAMEEKREKSTGDQMLGTGNEYLLTWTGK